MAPIYAQIIGCGVAACLAGVGYLAARYDIFRKAKWEICPMEGFTYVYVEHLGPYKTVGKSFNKLKAELEAVGMNLSWDKDRFVGAGQLRARMLYIARPAWRSTVAHTPRARLTKYS